MCILLGPCALDFWFFSISEALKCYVKIRPLLEKLGQYLPFYGIAGGFGVISSSSFQQWLFKIGQRSWNLTKVSSFFYFSLL